MQGKVCSRCQRAGCVIPQADKITMFQQFRKVDYNAQNLILASSIHHSAPKERTVPAQVSRRKNTFHFTINHLGRTLPICKRSLKNLYTISDKRYINIEFELLTSEKTF